MKVSGFQRQEGEGGERKKEAFHAVKKWFNNNEIIEKSELIF